MIDEQQVHCPCCDEEFTALIDASAGDQSYIEDCDDCGQPLKFSVTSNGETIIGLDVCPVDE